MGNRRGRIATVAGVVIVSVVLSIAAAASVGSGQAHAASVPTLALTQSGNTDWAVTFDRGTTNAKACDIYVGGRKRVASTTGLTYVIGGETVAPGRYPVTVRCAGRSSPAIWLQAPRSQINDLFTWFSNFTAGALGV